MIKPFLEMNTARDEFVGNAIGFFIGEYCLFGMLNWSDHKPHVWQVGIIFFNKILGLWNDPGERNDTNST